MRFSGILQYRNRVKTGLLENLGSVTVLAQIAKLPAGLQKARRACSPLKPARC